VDWTYPDPIVIVNDSLGNDIDLLITNTDLWGRWSASADTNSGLSRYWFAIGTQSCDSNVVAWTNNWGYDTAHVGSLNLNSGQWYYFSVRAENGAGLVTPCYSSDGVLVDITTGIYTSSAHEISATVGPVPATEIVTIHYTLTHEGTVVITLYSANGPKDEHLPRRPSFRSAFAGNKQ